MGTRRYFWSKWPPASQERFFKLSLRGIWLVSLAVFIGLGLFGRSLEKQIEESKEQYALVVPIVEDILSLRAQQGDLARLPVKEAAWAIIDDLGLEPRLASLRSVTEEDGDAGVRMAFDGLSQVALVDFFTALRDRASLQTRQCTITRNQGDPRLADVRLMLVR